MDLSKEAQLVVVLFDLFLQYLFLNYLSTSLFSAMENQEQLILARTNCQSLPLLLYLFLQLHLVCVSITVVLPKFEFENTSHSRCKSSSGTFVNSVSCTTSLKVSSNKRTKYTMPFIFTLTDLLIKFKEEVVIRALPKSNLTLSLVESSMVESYEAKPLPKLVFLWWNVDVCDPTHLMNTFHISPTPWLSGKLVKKKDVNPTKYLEEPP